MKKFFKAKNQLIIFIIALAILASSAGFFIFKFNKNVDIARAGTGDNLFGFAWNSNIGWISFNSTDCDTDDNGFVDTDLMVQGCGGDNATDIVFDYGVSIDPIIGSFSGYAWSNNVGWVSFAGGDTPPGSFAFSANCYVPAYCDEISDNCTACFNPTDNNVYGWAKILSLGNAGDEEWIRLDDDNTGDAVDYGIVFGGSDFSGWAWNANDNGLGIGWVSFNCADQGVCATSDYKVSVEPMEQPVITSVAPVPGFKCSMLKVDWGDVDGEAGYRVYGDDYSPPTTQVSVDLSQGATSFSNPGLLPDTVYYYIVEVFNVFTSTDSEIASGKTFAVCEVFGVEASGLCPNTIELSWLADAYAVYYEVQRCNETYSECTNEIFSAFIAGDDCFDPIANSCTDNTILNPAEVEDYFQYRVRAVSSLGEEGDWSELSNEAQACPGMPTWKEVK
ncbi:hypothetical protein KKH38_03675 [Patescibacteria group bacterium]|nr:hypothetical protein [Patescibacteria group bacterium]MBU4601007.1 hypothetical protein [Patescibacteria group bacterium]MCG2697686.1 hypothetical protein [Candidatus Parcubacteria bacterium]